jgi:hypothetical protein
MVACLPGSLSAGYIALQLGPSILPALIKLTRVLSQDRLHLRRTPFRMACAGTGTMLSNCVSSTCTETLWDLALTLLVRSQ